MKHAALIVLLAASSPAVAQVANTSAPKWPVFSAERAGSARYRECLGQDASMVKEGNCLADEYTNQKAQLASVYRSRLKGDLPRERAQRILAQRAWTQFRDANCKVRALNTGSGAGIFYWGCMVRETITRRAELTNSWDY